MGFKKRNSRSNEIRKTRWGVGLLLLDGPLTLDEIIIKYETSPFSSSGQPGYPAHGPNKARRLKRVPDNLAGLIEVGWVVQEGDRYALTERGREQINLATENARTSLKWISDKLRSLLRPESASKVTLVIQAILALIKLPAGVLSGSVGLINDSADTILDLFSSLLVYLGIRFNKERLVSILLVVFMLGTGIFTLFEAVQRIFIPFVPKVDLFPFAAAILSALAGLFLWTFQRYVGIKSGLMTFITESVDARNHVIVAISVTAGLIASLLQFGLLDMLVGLGVAILILWSAIELTVDLVRSSTDKQVHISRYGFWLQDFYEHARDARLKDWMMYLINHREVKTRSDLLDKARQAFDFRNNPWMESIGLNREIVSEKMIKHSLDELFSSGLVIDQNPLILSPKGKEYLKRQSKHHRRWSIQKIKQPQRAMKLEKVS